MKRVRLTREKSSRLWNTRGLREVPGIVVKRWIAALC